MTIMINKDSNLTPASVFIPHLQEWASICGACLEDGNFRLIWKTESGNLGTMALDTAAELVKHFSVPF